jgi:hypothetical protein
VTVNSKPTISAITNRTIYANTNTGPISFIIGDTETSAGSLTLAGASSNPTLVPVSNIVFGGNGASRTVTVTPQAGQTGAVTITITVSDGSATANTGFQLAVQTAPPAPPSNLVIISTSGIGIVIPNLNGQALTAGKAYTIAAIPGEGQIFEGWSGSIVSSNPKLTFVGGSNLVLQAKFIRNPYLPITGTYSGLFYDDDEVKPDSAGTLTLKVTPGGTYSGMLQRGKIRSSFSGKLNTAYEATNVVRSGTSSLVLTLRVGSSNQIDKLFGVLSDVNWDSAVAGDRAVFSTTAPAPLAGDYTVVVPGSDGVSPIDMGDGYGSVRVDTKGKVKLKGALADGSKFTQSAMVSKEGYWPLFVSLYNGGGLMISWLTFTNRPNDDINGTLSWIKPGGLLSKYAAFYANGFTNECELGGSRFIKPLATNLLINLPTGTVSFEGGNLASDFSNEILLGPKSLVANLGNNLMSLKFSTSKGTFSGSVVDPSNGRLAKFQGAVLQKLDAGFGFLLATNQSSRVVISP